MEDVVKQLMRRVAMLEREVAQLNGRLTKLEKK